VNKIENVQQLRAEIKRLEQRRVRQEAVLKNDAEEFMQKIRPAMEMMNSLGQTGGANQGILSKGMGMAVNMLVQNVLLKNSPFLMKTIINLLMQNFSTPNAEKPTGIFDKIKDLFGKFTGKKEEPLYPDEFDYSK
jgi:hypothetical protein